MRPNLRAEQEIMKNWKGTKPVVSICCLAYNHEPYIEDALEGFLIQETDFPFEVLIHDDASTDRTPDIIREYEAAYPHIIKPIYQKENQYSKHVKISATYQFPRAQGEYIAFCEGDDYWNNNQKLQKQVNYMRAHFDCSIVAHLANLLIADTNKIVPYLSSKYMNYVNRRITIKDILVNLALFPTASMLFKTELYKRNNTLFLDICDFDYAYKIILLSEGYGFILPEVMSVYRKGVIGSWTDRANNKQYFKKHLLESCQILQKINIYTQYKNDKEIKNEIIKRQFNIILLEKDTLAIRREPYHNLYKKKTILFKLIWRLSKASPKLFCSLADTITKLKQAIYHLFYGYGK